MGRIESGYEVISKWKSIQSEKGKTKGFLLLVSQICDMEQDVDGLIVILYKKK